ncbi:DUF55-domain-containing protein [Leucogyrophana mollusca]|uniref:DUF55-domain-containing protein n=1 Tax=Leucogyrophana mollusca TaxID=85980 RepID=A0ACB8C1T1_9AGAM|nr:DUF55-domain-containing protein [Leucogyrophana mollusca]
MSRCANHPYDAQIPKYQSSKIVKSHLCHIVQFGVDDFESVKTTPWEGVRNFEARNLMKEMVPGDKILFYHSNCKNPGIAGFAEVSKEAYPDYTAWDSSHPYFDPKTKQDDPKWFMIDATFVSRAQHFVPLSLLRYIADSSGAEPPDEVGYIGAKGVKAIKAMPLVTRGRLSVQRVDEEAWSVVQTLAEQGGWEDMPLGKKSTGKGKSVKKAALGGSRQGTKEQDGAEQDEEAVSEGERHPQAAASRAKKRKFDGAQDEQGSAEAAPRRRSARVKK